MKKYDGDKCVESYASWNQLFTLMFWQLSNRESLRGLIVAMEAHEGKLYHPGIGKSVTRSNLSKADEQRDYRIYDEFTFHMIAEARKRRIRKILELDGHVYDFDSTTIDLCLSVFEWAKFRKHKGGIKMRTLCDVEAQVPAFVHIFLTNNLTASAETVAELYRNRWSEELYFNWIKQHLRIKKFWGTSENAVRIQMCCAIITYCLVAIVRHDIELERSIYEVLQILGISLTDKTRLRNLFDKSTFQKCQCSLWFK